jgi:hypothetical protein
MFLLRKIFKTHILNVNCSYYRYVHCNIVYAFDRTDMTRWLQASSLSLRWSRHVYLSSQTIFEQNFIAINK